MLTYHSQEYMTWCPARHFTEATTWELHEVKIILIGGMIFTSQRAYVSTGLAHQCTLNDISLKVIDLIRSLFPHECAETLVEHTAEVGCTKFVLKGVYHNTYYRDTSARLRHQHFGHVKQLPLTMSPHAQRWHWSWKMQPPREVTEPISRHLDANDYITEKF